MTRRYTDADDLARRIVAETGGEIRLALPLGLGKPVSIVNALTRLAAADPDISLSIFTALTLERPNPSSEIEARFLEPAMDRLFGAYPTLEYARMQRDGTMPSNITVSEFFFMAGNWLGNETAQRRYISANYTHALDVLVEQKPNVLAQLLACDGDRVSLSCNSDISADLFHMRRAGRLDFIAVGEVNDALPFMPGQEAVLDADAFAMLLDGAEQFELFSAPRRPVSDDQHAIGLHVARMIPDGGTLQIGIGAIGDAVANGLLLRAGGKAEPIWDSCSFPQTGGHTGQFDSGLYGVTEMLVGGLVHLFDAGVIRRDVDGAAIHAGFFVESRDIYEGLRAMDLETRSRIVMKPVSFTNALYGDESARRAARPKARFVNGAMQASLLGDIMSDSAEPGQVVSGVGGQFNFVEQAFALDDGRAVITLPATRTSGGSVSSNIVWSVPVTTVPRHMRDIVVTEYGTADLRGKPDEEVIAAMICIADSRFQLQLVEQAKSAGKIAADWRVPRAHQNNLPESLRTWLAPWRDTLLPDFPFGTDFDETEQQLLPALSLLSETSSNRLAQLKLVLASFRLAPHPQEAALMQRMGYAGVSRLAEPLTARALRGALRRVAALRQP